MHLIANVSLLFTERPLLERIPSAISAGFDGVEIQFPYGSDPVLIAQAAAGCPIHLINAPAGDPDAGDVSLSTDAGRVDGFRKGIETARRYADVLDCRMVNVLAGRPPVGQATDLTRQVLVGNVRSLADALAPDGRQVMVEMVNPFDVPGYFIDNLEDALDLLVEIDHPAVSLQFDLYHVARTEPDLIAAIYRAADVIGHVQFADHPGRNEPGTGNVDLETSLRLLRSIGYTGAISAEYRPSGRTEACLDWMPAMRAAMAPRTVS